jgi:hypothetical protein
MSREASALGQDVSGRTFVKDCRSPRSSMPSGNATLIPHPPKVSERYNQMLQEYDRTSIWFNISAALSLWALLLSFVLFSGTFATLRTFGPNSVEEVVISKIHNLPMLLFAIIFCVTSTGALIFLSWKWKRNYIWLTRQVFL